MRRAIFFIVIAFICIIVFLFGNSYAGSSKEDYELQERCGKRAAEYFKEVYGNGISKVEGGTMTTNYINHYNRKLNRCFALFTTMYIAKKGQGCFYKELLDINENKSLGNFHRFGDSKGNEKPYCFMSGRYCTSESEWDSLVKPYMEE